ncbi:hypothetical protein GCM10010436_41680 [Paractinoplanes durhamensis]
MARGGVSLVRDALFDLAQDDKQAGELLRVLGPRFAWLREELAADPEPRLRLRALRSFPERTPDVTARFLGDPAPLVRVAAVEEATHSIDPAMMLPLLADPDPMVRYWVASRFVHAEVDAEPFLAAIRAESDVLVLRALLRALARRRTQPGALPVVTGFLAAGPPLAEEAAILLRNVDDPGVAAAIATGILVTEDRAELSGFLRYRHLLRHAPEVRDLVEHLLLGSAHQQAMVRLVLSRPDGVPEPPPTDLTGEQRTRLLREVVSWAAASLSRTEPAAAALQTWLDAAAEAAAAEAAAAEAAAAEAAADEADAAAAAADEADAAANAAGADAANAAGADAANAAGAEAAGGGNGDAGAAGPSGDSLQSAAIACLRAAVRGDIEGAMTAGIRAAAEAARQDPDLGEIIEPDLRSAAREAVAGHAAELARLAHHYTAAQIRHGLEPLPAGRIRHLRPAGEDPRVPELVVRLAEGLAFLAPGRPTATEPDARPQHAATRTACPSCGLRHRVAGALTWQYRDDDRYAESEDGLAGTLTGDCPACATPAAAEVRVSLIRSRGDGSAELTWDRRDGAGRAAAPGPNWTADR